MGSGTSFSFDINVLSSCTVAVLTVDSTIFFPTTSYTTTQAIWQTVVTKINWTDVIVTVRDLNSNIITTCGALVYDFLDLGSISLIATSEFNFSLTNKWFSMNTILPAKAGDWLYKLKVTL